MSSAYECIGQIFGIQAGMYKIATVQSTGYFFCPACVTETPYKRKIYRSFYYIYYIPLVPCGTQDKVKCSRCENKFDPEEVECLAARALARAKRQGMEWNVALLRAMMALATADGQTIKQSKIDCIWATFRAITKMPRDAIVEIAEELDGCCSSSRGDVEAELCPFARIVSQGQKLRAIRGLCDVACADNGGELRDYERELIDEAASALGVGRYHVDRHLSALQEKKKKLRQKKADAARVVVAAEAERPKSPSTPPRIPDDAPAKAIAEEARSAAEAEKPKSPPTPTPIPDAPAKAIKEEARSSTEAKKQNSPLPPPPIPDPLARAITEEAAALSLETLMARIDDYRLGKWDQRASYVLAAVESWADNKAATGGGCPNSATGNLFKGALMINRAWEVPRQQARVYLLYLKMAREALLRSAEQDPEDPTPYAFLAGSVAVGLQVGQEQAQEWFQAAVKRDPFNYVAHTGRLQSLSLECDGSHAALHAFTEEAVRKAPPRSLLRTIRYRAFYEQWFFHKIIVGDKIAARNYLRDGDVQRETLTIFRQVLDKGSIENLFQCKVHKNAAKWLIFCAQHKAANAELNKLRPWRRLLDEDLRNRQERVLFEGECTNSTTSKNENPIVSTEAADSSIGTHHQLVESSSSQRRVSF